jgi:hypothetical protein
MFLGALPISSSPLLLLVHSTYMFCPYMCIIEGVQAPLTSKMGTSFPFLKRNFGLKIHKNTHHPKTNRGYLLP